MGVLSRIQPLSTAWKVFGGFAMFVGLVAGVITIWQVAQTPPDERWLVARDGETLTIGPAHPPLTGIVKSDKIRFEAGKILLENSPFFIANEIRLAPGTTLMPPEDGVVRIAATRLTGGQIDASGRPPGSSGDEVLIIAARISGTTIAANGAPGHPGADGRRGHDGRNGDCAGFGGWEGAQDGGDGKNGEGGGNGGNGGTVEIFSNFSVEIKPVARGGRFGPGGQGGAGGRGGTGCTGLGGHQSPHPNGQRGNNGRDGTAGRDGKISEHYVKFETAQSIIREQLKVDTISAEELASQIVTKLTMSAGK